MKDIDIDKATGPDLLPGRILKECAEELAHPITQLVRQMLAQRIGKPQKVRAIRAIAVQKHHNRAGLARDWFAAFRIEDAPKIGPIHPAVLAQLINGFANFLQMIFQDF